MKPWHKWYAQKWLESETRKKMTPTDRYVFKELIDLSSAGSDPGIVQDTLGQGHSTKALGGYLNIDARTVTKSLKHLCKLGSINVSSEGVIIINNYWEYQTKPKDRSEYWKERYAKLKAITQGAHQVDTQCAHAREGDRDGEGEGEREIPLPAEDGIPPAPPWSAEMETAFNDTFVQSFRHKPAWMQLTKAGELVRKLGGLEPLLKMMREYGEQDKKWAWLVEDVENPKPTKKKRDEKRAEAALEPRGQDTDIYDDIDYSQEQTEEAKALVERMRKEK